MKVLIAFLIACLMAVVNGYDMCRLHQRYLGGPISMATLLGIADAVNSWPDRPDRTIWNNNGAPFDNNKGRIAQKLPGDATYTKWLVFPPTSGRHNNPEIIISNKGQVYISFDECLSFCVAPPVSDLCWRDIDTCP